jgi:circadian clock protein KaiB
MNNPSNLDSHKNSELALPQVFKGIALFTPGGDLLYCIDATKKNRWHLHLCAALQEMLGLSEPPHFLVPAYTATIDRWFDHQTGQLRVAAEAYPPVLRYQPLLNAVFSTGNLAWSAASWPKHLNNPFVIATYRPQFPQLWEDHDLIVRIDQSKMETLTQPQPIMPETPQNHGYILRLFVSGQTPTTERTLQRLHQLLEQFLNVPYTLKVIDVFKHPEQAEADHVTATPTFMKVWPRPIRRIVGELENIEEILRILKTT